MSARFARCVSLLVVPGISGVLLAAATSPGAPVRAAGISSSLLRRVKPTFIRNRGQVRGPAEYYVAGRDRTVYFTPAGLTYSLRPERAELRRGALSAAPQRPTLVVLHHPPFPTGIVHMDEVSLRDPDALEAVIRRHPQVERVLIGHAHRPIVVRFGGTLAQVAPSVAHQFTLDLRPDGPATLMFEPPAFLLHHWRPEGRLVTHQVYVGEYSGPHPLGEDDS